MRNDLESGENSNNSRDNQISRRRLLKLAGAGAAGVAGTSILAACWGEPSKTGGGAGIMPTAPTTPEDTATVTTGPGRQMVPYFLGYNNVPNRSPSWTDPNVINIAKQLNIGTVRYPAGTLANYWDWQSGWLLPGGPSRSQKHSTFTLQDLQVAVQSTGAKPIFVLNMLTSDLNTQLNMLHTAQGMGLPVQYIELGNEFYLAQPDDYVRKFPQGSDYGSMATQWINAIHQQFPNSKVAAVGTAPASGDQRKSGWNQSMLQTLQGADAITIHPYVLLDDNLVAQTTNGGADTLMSAVSGRWQQFQGLLQPLPSGMKVWVTEYNLVNASNLFRTWIHGLSVAQMTLSYLADDRVELVCFFDMIGAAGDEAYFYDLTPNSGDQLPPYTPTASAWTLGLLGKALRGMTSAQQLPIGNAGDTSVMGWLFTNGSQHQAFIVNASSNNMTWNVDNALSKAQYQQLTSDPLKLITSSGSLTTKNGTAGGQLALPAYSVTLLKVGAAN